MIESDFFTGQNCFEICDDEAAFYIHVVGHANENPAGPCHWRSCDMAKLSSGGAANKRERRVQNQPRFIEYHIKSHCPKKPFKCFMDGCNRSYETADKLNNHIANHPHLKRVDEVVLPLEDASDGRIRETIANVFSEWCWK